MNAEDRRRLEGLYELHRKAVQEAQPGTLVSLHVRIDQGGHVCRSSHVQPQIRPPDET